MDEYRADMTECASCRIELIFGEQVEQMEMEQQRRVSSSEIAPDEEVMAVRKGLLRDMKTLQSLLAAEGFGTILATDENSCGKGCCGNDVYLSVRTAEVRDVMAVLERDHVHSTGLEEHDTNHASAVFNTSAEEAVCPACGNNFSTANAACPDCGLCFV